jgi:hypothetical protein
VLLVSFDWSSDSNQNMDYVTDNQRNQLIHNEFVSVAKNNDMIVRDEAGTSISFVSITIENFCSSSSIITEETWF